MNTDPNKPGKSSLTCSRKEHWFLPHRLIFSKVLLACDFAVSPSSIPVYSQVCHCVCLAGQARRRSEEEQGDEGGSLPVDERTRGKRTHQFRELKKKRRKNKQTTEQERNENELTVTWNDSIDVVILNILYKAKLDLKIQNRQQVFVFFYEWKQLGVGKGGIGEGKILNCNIFCLVSRQKKTNKTVFGKRLPVV